MDEKEIAEYVKRVHREIYDKRSYSSIFSGGNVGLIYLGNRIKESAEILATAIRESNMQNDFE